MALIVKARLNETSGKAEAYIGIPMNGSPKSIQHFTTRVKRALNSDSTRVKPRISYEQQHVCLASIDIDPKDQDAAIRQMSKLKTFALGVTNMSVWIDARELASLSSH